MGLAATGRPNCALFTVVFQPVKTTWLSRFVVVQLKSSRRRPSRPNWIVLESPELIVNAPGPITEFRGASPKHAVGMVNAAVLNHSRMVGFDSEGSAD